MRTELSHSKEVWISLIEVEALHEVDGFTRGQKAFSNGVVVADSREDAEHRLGRALADLGYHAVSFEDTEELAIRSGVYNVDEQLVGLAESCRATGMAQFGTFHTWDTQG